jgi:hypothetical protein
VRVADFAAARPSANGLPHNLLPALRARLAHEQSSSCSLRLRSIARTAASVRASPSDRLRRVPRASLHLQGRQRLHLLARLSGRRGRSGPDYVGVCSRTTSDGLVYSSPPYILISGSHSRFTPSPVGAKQPVREFHYI